MIDRQTIEYWKINYDLEKEPHELAELWKECPPIGAVLALKVAVIEIERMREALIAVSEDDEHGIGLWISEHTLGLVHAALKQQQEDKQWVTK